MGRLFKLSLNRGESKPLYVNILLLSSQPPCGPLNTSLDHVKMPFLDSWSWPWPLVLNLADMTLSCFKIRLAEHAATLPLQFFSVGENLGGQPYALIPVHTIPIE